jgi:hypothetical protein
MRHVDGIRCLTCGTDEQIHIPWTPANVLRAVANGIFLVVTLPVTLVVFLLGMPRVYMPFTLTRRCSGCGGLFLKGWIYKSTKGECPRCHYDLTGNMSGTCPECGYRLDPRLLRRDDENRQGRPT